MQLPQPGPDLALDGALGTLQEHGHLTIRVPAEVRESDRSTLARGQRLQCLRDVMGEQRLQHGALDRLLSLVEQRVGILSP